MKPLAGADSCNAGRHLFDNVATINCDNLPVGKTVAIIPERSHRFLADQRWGQGQLRSARQSLDSSRLGVYLGG